ncbi:MAG: transcription antitermination factor NusB [Pseudomonadota bacterium]
MSSGARERAQAARALGRLLREQRTLDQLEPDPPFAPFVRELLYGTTRHFYSLAAQLAPFLKQPLRAKDQDVYALLLIGAYQLVHLRVPDHAAVAETVAATRQLGKPWARALVNACLRNLRRSLPDAPADQPRQQARTAPSPYTTDEVRFDLPQWLIDGLQADYGAAAATIAAACGDRAPMSLRVQPGREAAVEAALERQDRAYTTPFRRETWILDKPLSVTTLDEFVQGACSAQDAGAQLAFSALEQLREAIGAERGFRWLDACCAPGGKLFHALEQWRERAPETLAVDLSERRLQQVRREAERLGFDANSRLEVQAADVSSNGWYAGPAFDLALIDAPCSGSGTLRRHPDIKLLREAGAIADQAQTQGLLLDSVAGSVRPGGGLLYATCSLLCAENDRVVEGFLKRHAHWTPLPLSLPTGQQRQFGWQLTPADPRTDGFYYAAMKQLQ